MNKKKIEEAVYNLLLALGENPKRDGLINTPKRVANMYEELLEAPDLKYTTFEEEVKPQTAQNPDLVRTPEAIEIQKAFNSKGELVKKDNSQININNKCV